MLDVTKLNYSERETYNSLLKQMEAKRLTIDDLKTYVQEMLFSTVRDLVELSNKEAEKSTLLKARVKNYLLLYDLLSGPEKMEKRLTEVIRGFEEKVGD